MVEENKSISNQHSSVRHQVADMFMDKICKRSFPYGIPVDEGVLSVPANMISGNAYTSINNVILSNAGQLDPRWMTRKQAEENGLQVKEEALGQKLVFWGQQAGDDQKSRPVMKFYTVYNARDLTNAKGQSLPLYERPEPTVSPYEVVEAMLNNSGMKTMEVSPRDIGYDARQGLMKLPSKEYESDYYTMAISGLVQHTVNMERMKLPSKDRPNTPREFLKIR